MSIAGRSRLLLSASVLDSLLTVARSALSHVGMTKLKRKATRMFSALVPAMRFLYQISMLYLASIIVLVASFRSIYAIRPVANVGEQRVVFAVVMMVFGYALWTAYNRLHKSHLHRVSQSAGA
jgi:uncharacterized membrane protein (DUF485 family)